jgi:hypothetical protein
MIADSGFHSDHGARKNPQTPFPAALSPSTSENTCKQLKQFGNTPIL